VRVCVCVVCGQWGKVQWEEVWEAWGGRWKVWCGVVWWVCGGGGREELWKAGRYVCGRPRAPPRKKRPKWHAQRRLPRHGSA